MRQDRGYGFGNKEISFPHLGYKHHEIADFYSVLEDPSEYKSIERRDPSRAGYGFENLRDKFRRDTQRVMICDGDACTSTAYSSPRAAAGPQQIDLSAMREDLD